MTYVITYTTGSGNTTVTYRGLSSESEARNKFLSDSIYKSLNAKIVSISSHP